MANSKKKNPILQEGFLKKHSKSPFGDKWKEVWCVLHQADKHTKKTLEWKKKEDDEHIKGSVVIKSKDVLWGKLIPSSTFADDSPSSITTSEKGCNPMKWLWVIKADWGKHHFFLCASDDDMNEWIWKLVRKRAVTQNQKKEIIPQAALLPRILKGGWLQKHYKWILGDKWKRVWCVLCEDSTLWWFKKKSGKTPLGTIFLRDVVHGLKVGDQIPASDDNPSSIVNGQKDCLWVVPDQTCDKKHFFLCESQECLREWKKKIHVSVRPAVSSSHGPRQAQASGCTDPPVQRNKCVGEATEDGEKSICYYNIEGKCLFAQECSRLHCDLPYQWQFLNPETQNWDCIEGQENEDIEELFCNADVDVYIPDEKSDRNPDIMINFINFDEMEMTFDDPRQRSRTTQVKRLSTGNRATCPVDLLLLTNWIWYWQDDAGQYNMYETYVTSEVLEEVFANKQQEKFQWSTDKYGYIIDFKSMVQTNQETGKTRKIRRRPEYIDLEEVEALTKSSRDTRGASKEKWPEHWDQSDMNKDDDYQLVPTSKTMSPMCMKFEVLNEGKTSEEYMKIWLLFHETMDANKYRIQLIQRLQNMKHYRRYMFLKEEMISHSLSGVVDERLLFHGTKANYIPAICQQGFDFRVSGMTTGTLYGKGSYFAKEASYSRDYTDSQQLFVVRVLVGEYAKGEASYGRPPAKDPNGTTLYDSCVDNVKDPKIFVVFAIDQALPEYLIDYRCIKRAK